MMALFCVALTTSTARIDALETALHTLPKINSYRRFWSEQMRVLQWALFSILMTLSQSNSAQETSYHRLHYCNIGPVDLTSIKIQYGKVVWPFYREEKYGGKGDTRCTGGASVSDNMVIPETMDIYWKTAEGKEFTVTTPVRAKLSRTHPVNTIEVRFNDEQVEVFEILRPPLQQEIEVRIFP